MKTATVSKGRIFRLTVEIDEDRLRAMGKAPEAAEKALIAGADYWHTGILPHHFERAAHAKYDYADRGKIYRRTKRGAPDLVYSGAMKSELLGRASFQKVGKALNLKMSARALNFAPSMPENNADHYVLHASRNGRRGAKYPNLKREIKAFTEPEREEIAQVITRQLEVELSPAGGSSSAATLAPPIT